MKMSQSIFGTFLTTKYDAATWHMSAVPLMVHYTAINGEPKPAVQYEPLIISVSLPQFQHPSVEVGDFCAILDGLAPVPDGALCDAQ